ncbi:MAG: lactonase family protein [Clostridium sp.]
MEHYKYHVGTYTSNGSKGIYSFSIVEDKFINLEVDYEIDNPTYLFKNTTNIYSISSSLNDNELFGGISSFSIMDKNLKFINSKHLKGKAPCHLCVNKDNSFLICGNYHENRILCYKLSNGEILECVSEVNHFGKGINLDRQEKPHIHYVCFSQDESKVYSLDLGIDMLMTYSFNKGVLTLLEEECFKFPEGVGPRHMIYHNSRFYILTELSGEIYTLEFNGDNFKLVHSIPLISNTFEGDPLGAAIKLHPNKRFIYASERGENKIHLLEIIEDELILKESFSTLGDGPRDFAISSDGEHLICCNQISNNIILFKISPNGYLTALDKEHVPSPVFVG